MASFHRCSAVSPVSAQELVENVSQDVSEQMSVSSAVSEVTVSDMVTLFETVLSAVVPDTDELLLSLQDGNNIHKDKATDNTILFFIFCSP